MWSAAGCGGGAGGLGAKSAEKGRLRAEGPSQWAGKLRGFLAADPTSRKRALSSGHCATQEPATDKARVQRGRLNGPTQLNSWVSGLFSPSYRHLLPSGPRQVWRLFRASEARSANRACGLPAFPPWVPGGRTV